MNKAQQTILWQDLKTARETLAACASIQEKIKAIQEKYNWIDIIYATEQSSTVSDSDWQQLENLQRELQEATIELFLTMQASKILDRLSIT